MLAELVDAGDATFSVFSPDATRSGLVRAIVGFVEESTGAVPISSFPVRHTAGSIERFYIHSVAGNLPHWYLVSRLFQFGTSVGVLWVGPDVQKALSALKGSSHPAEAIDGTIRSMYWCDNAVCNLIHVSDGPSDVEEELTSVGQGGLLDRYVSFPPAKVRVQVREKRRAEPRHCGVLMALTMAQRSATVVSANSIVPSRPIDEDARELQELGQESLLRTAEENVGLRDFIEGYLCGDLARMRTHARRLTANRWERFVLDCGCVGRKVWNRSDLRSVVQSIMEELRSAGRWLISGSTAMRLHGFRVTPGDIDVWLDSEAFLRVAEKLRGEVRTARLPHGRAHRMTLERSGWKVEYTGPIVRPSGIQMTVDPEMIVRANGHVQSVEDLVAELLVMKRRSPKRDLDRAYALYQQFGRRIDHAYLQRRLLLWGESSSSWSGPGTTAVRLGG